MEDLQQKLLESKWVTAEQLNLARQDSAKCGKSLWASLVKLGYISEEDISLFFAQESGIDYVRISDYNIKYEVLRLLDEDFCRENLIIPLFKINDTLFIASCNPLDSSLTDNISKLTGSLVELLFASSRSIAEALDLYWGPRDKIFKVQEFMYKQRVLQGLSFWRESERMDLNIPVSLKVEDGCVDLHYSSAIEGYTRNISRSGTALGVQTFLFLPRGTKLNLEFQPSGSLSENTQGIKAKGEIIYCHMERGQHYFLGIKLTEIKEEAVRQLFNLASRT